ncbi:MAG: DUF1289 domain-containing protein [Paraburkholderia sp.]|uniref:DUF1289 domain-containing protein n=1 Tax=Paraburkholderia sp. TaxID=1926495 RepID=UPI003C523CEA
MTAGTAASQDVVTSVPSPCINVCRMDDATGLCEGCLRTIDEVSGWATYDDASKRAVWDLLEGRHVQWLAQHQQARA